MHVDLFLVLLATSEALYNLFMFFIVKLEDQLVLCCAVKPLLLGWSQMLLRGCSEGPVEDLVKVGNSCMKVQLLCFPLLCASDLSCQLAACVQYQKGVSKVYWGQNKFVTCLSTCLH